MVKLRLERNRKKKAVKKEGYKAYEAQESPHTRRPYTKQKTESSKAKTLR